MDNNIKTTGKNLYCTGSADLIMINNTVLSENTEECENSQNNESMNVSTSVVSSFSVNVVNDSHNAEINNETIGKALTNLKLGCECYTDAVVNEINVVNDKNGQFDQKNKNYESCDSSIHDNYMTKIKDLIFLFNQINSVIKLVDHDIILQTILCYIKTSGKKDALENYHRFIALIKLVFKLKTILQMFGDSSQFFDEVSVILRLYFRIGEKVIKFMLNVLDSTEDDIHSLLRQLNILFNELKDMDVIDYLLTNKEKTSCVVNDSRIFASNSNVVEKTEFIENDDYPNNIEIDNQESSKLNEKLSCEHPMLTNQEKQHISQVFDMFGCVFAHFISTHIFCKKVMNCLVNS